MRTYCAKLKDLNLSSHANIIVSIRLSSLNGIVMHVVKTFLQKDILDA